jgi:hypothetical protein
MVGGVNSGSAVVVAVVVVVVALLCFGVIGLCLLIICIYDGLLSLLLEKLKLRDVMFCCFVNGVFGFVMRGGFDIKLKRGVLEDELCLKYFCAFVISKKLML